MAKQFLALVEEAARGTNPGAGFKFLPLRSGLQPKFQPKDEPRKEFRGQDTALGDASVRRLSSAWNNTLELNAYPGAERGLLLKHALGFAGVRAVLDTSAYKGILYPIAMPYGLGAGLGDTAVGLIANTDEEGTTKSQYWGGGRIRSWSRSIKADEDVVDSFELGGPGPYVGAVDQAETAGAAFPAATPFLYSDAKFYIGAGISRTGVAPNFTDVGAGTMVQFQPDEFNMKVSLGLEDKTVLNGVQGPSKTHRNAQASIECDFTIDYRDPASGFSSADEFKATFSGPRTNSLLVVLESSELAGAATAKYTEIMDFPLMLLSSDGPERDNEGKTAPVKLSWKALLNSTVGYPFALITIDKASAY